MHYRADKPGTALLEPKGSGNFAALTAFLVVASFITLILVAHGIAGKVLLVREGGVPLFAFILPFAALAIAAGAVYEYRRLHKLLHDSAAWPSVLGRIAASSVIEEQSTRTDDDGKESTSTTYRPHIAFAYEVGGREFHSTQWNWGWTTLYAGDEKPRAIIARYKPSASVAVHYDPKEPENAVLEPGDRQGTTVPLVIAFIFGVGGALMFWAFTVLHN